MSVCIAIKINGIVQGVGFRPHVFRLASELGLGGSIRNDAEGVFIRLRGPKYRVDEFIASLQALPPPLARIDHFEILDRDIPAGIAGADDAHESNDNRLSFIIEPSKAGGETRVVVSADKSMCSDCLADIHNPADRHFRYPFTNCTNCGPRYSLIKALPYDRQNTSMAGFAMCPECEAEYHNPLDRRYHAQPVSCPRCGPSLCLTRADGTLISNQNAICLDECVRLIREGAIVAIKGLGGFHLVCDASNEAAVSALRLRKHRPAKPLAVMVSDLAMAKDYAEGCDAEWQLLASRERPIVVLQTSRQTNPSRPLAASVAPGIDRIGLFLPYTPLHALLLEALGRPMVATSANRSGEPIIIEARDIQAKLATVVDYILDHNRPIVSGCDDSVVQWCAGQLQVIRMARGYAPMALTIEQALAQQLLSVGAQQKNTLGVGLGHNLFLSPHIGDLFSIEAEDYFARTLESFKRLYQVRPERLIADQHPDYAPSRFARDWVAAAGDGGNDNDGQGDEDRAGSLKLATVQHHFAHVLAVMAVNNTQGPVLGFSFDGTGLGDDGSLWGGEVLRCTATGFERVGGLMPFPLPGGDKASREPWRLVISLLHDRLDEAELASLGCLSHLSAMALGNHIRVASCSSVLKSSSMGRLFDAAAALLGLCHQIQFEGQAGMLLEAAAARAQESRTPIPTLTLATLDPTSGDANKLRRHNDSLALHNDCLALWDGGALLLSLYRELQALEALKPTEAMRAAHSDALAAAFIEAIAKAICVSASRFRDLPLVLCGGVFQNRTLSNLSHSALTEAGMRVLPWGQVPVNDGGIALGQLWYGAHNVQ